MLGFHLFSLGEMLDKPVPKVTFPVTLRGSSAKISWLINTLCKVHFASLVCYLSCACPVFVSCHFAFNILRGEP
jgi:hypothetical protein